MASAAVLSPSPSPSLPASANDIRRLSSTSSSAHSSSVGSYRTAPLGISPSPPSSSSSLHTLEAPLADSAHPLDTALQMETGPVLNNISPTMSSVVKDDVKHDEAKPNGVTMLGGDVVYDEPEALHDSGVFPESPRDRLISVSSSASTARAVPIRASMPTDTRFQDTVPPAEHHESPPHLHPPSIMIQPPTRRNTMQTLPSRVGGHQHLHFASQPYDDVEEDDVASDIQIHAERIRRERLERRAQQQQAEAALTRTETKKGDDAPLVGNLIGEDHVNYVLMYNMLTGIRIGVSRCQAKIRRPLTDEDFTSARHKYSFDVVGNELTPSAKYDFKFKDYAPWVFRSLREDYFLLDPADYLLSLTSKYILSELGSPGKSGSFFYFSRDYRFIIKTIRHSEHKFLLRILKQYYNHVKDNPQTLLSRFYGLHRVKLPHGRKIHFVIMNNLFPPHKDIHETYDLKGSTIGREYPEELKKDKNNAVLKDLNWINRGHMLELGPEKRALLTEQLRRDTELLKSVRVMDYSLLVGIHKMARGNRDNVRRNTLKIFEPDVELPQGRHRRRPTITSGRRYNFSPEAIAMRRAMRESEPKEGAVQLPEKDTGDRQHFLFYQDEGGLRATSEANEFMDTIYYLGVIDILTPYSLLKKVEHCWKGLQVDRHKISPVPPEEYGERFFAFMRAIMRGGGGGESFR